MRRVVAAAVAALLVPVGVLFIAPTSAQALTVAPVPVTPSPTVADKTPYPAALIASLLGDVVPGTRATETLTYQMNEWSNDGGIVGDLGEGYSIAQHVPGFRLGTKIGGWIDSALGIGPGPADDFVPYADNPATTTQWNPDTEALVWGDGTSMGLSLTIDLPASMPSLPTYGSTALYNFGKYLEGRFTPAVPLPFSGSASWGLTLSCVDGTTIGGGSAGLSGVTASGGQSFDDTVNAGASSSCSASAGGLSYVTYRLVWSSTAHPGNAGNVYNYCPVGSSCAPPPVQAEPLREWAMHTSCSDGTNTLVASSTFKETDTSFPVWPQPSDCASGYMTGWELDLADTSGTTVETVESWTIPDDLATLNNAHPECLSTQGALCGVTLWKLGADGSTWADCFLSGDACSGWATDPARTTDYKCTYGLLSATDPSTLEDIGLAGCNMYGPTFDLGKRAGGKLYSDPGADPGSGGETDNDPGSTTIGAASPAPNGSCFPSGWSALNPVEWVLQPIECAFIPDPAKVSAALSSAWSTVSTRPPFSVVLPLVGTVQAFGSSLIGPCDGDIANFGDSLTVPCQPPAGISAYVTTFKGIFAVVFFGYTVFDLWRFIEKATIS